MNYLSDDALRHIIGCLRPLAALAPFYATHSEGYVVHGVGLGHPPYSSVITVADLRRAKDVVDGYDSRLIQSA